MIKAVLWDVDGTLAETERDGHLVAFNRAFEALNVPWRWSEQRYGELLTVAGGRERLVHDMQLRVDAPSDRRGCEALAKQVHRLKNEFYAEIVASGELRLRGGVRELLEDCAGAGLRTGIVTTTSRSNVEALFGRHFGNNWASNVDVLVCAEEAPRKKPDPQAYLLALDALQLHSREAVAIEDAPAGVSSACAAGVPVIVARSYFFAAARFEGALAVGPSLSQTEGWNPAVDRNSTRIGLDQINRWHVRKDNRVP
jgi:HAD superfamily hydrolase (TIGR01509 family)